MMILDTNAWYAYFMDFRGTGRNGRPVRVRRRNRDAVVVAVDGAAESGNLAIPHAVAIEVRRGMEYAFRSAARSAGIAADLGKRAAEDALEKFNRLHGIFGIHDDDGRSEEIDCMYACIWLDPRMACAVALWRRVKERRGGGGAGRPSLGTHGVDFVILSTAAGLAARGEAVELLTFDHDFVAFAGAIRGRFGVVVVDCAGLRR